jgi:hypothetical protein
MYVIGSRGNFLEVAPGVLGFAEDQVVAFWAVLRRPNSIQQSNTRTARNADAAWMAISATPAATGRILQEPLASELPIDTRSPHTVEMMASFAGGMAVRLLLANVLAVTVFGAACGTP